MPCPGCGALPSEEGLVVEHCTSNTCTWFVCKVCKIIFDVVGRSMADRDILK